MRVKAADAMRLLILKAYNLLDLRVKVYYYYGEKVRIKRERKCGGLSIGRV